MRKYGKWLLVLGIMAAHPAVSSADGFLSGLRQKVPFAGASQKEHNQQMAEKVASALREARLNGTGIEIVVQGDIVRLDGKVRDVTHRALASRVCQSVQGISRVENNLRYVPSGNIQQTSATVAADAPAAQSNSVRPAAFETDSNPFGQIEQIHFQKPGRREATPQAQTRQPAARPRQQAGPNNQQVAQNVGNSLAQAGLRGYDIEIRYDGGIASLGGEVATVGQMQAAVQAASRVPGVQRVDNRLQVSGPIAQASFMAPPAPPAMPVSMAQAGAMQGAMPTSIGGVGAFSNPHLPSHAWPAYAQYPNSAAVTYPTQYSASAWPYIGPFYPYPQVPLDWREARLEWDDGYWQLNFNEKKPAWYWLLSPKNW